MSRSLLAALFVLPLLVSSVAAGPCVPCGSGLPDLGWWDDRALTTVGRPQSPRIDVDERNGRPWIVVVWEDRSTGNGDLWIGTSLDWGCSFDIRAFTTGPEDDRLPDVAASFALNTVVVTFVRDGRVYAVASTDGGVTMSVPAPVHPTAVVDASSLPRVAGIIIDQTFHVHVVWAVGGTMLHARNLLGGLPGSWQSGPPLSDRLLGFTDWRDVDVAADTRSSDPATMSAITIVATALAPARTVPEVFALRSHDSGVTFWGDPTVVLTLNTPRRISDPRPNDPTLATYRPLLDASDSGNAAFFNWSLASWSEPRAGQLSCSLDARAEEGTVPTLIADWNDPPIAADVPFASSLPATALALIPNPLARPPTPEFHVFGEDDTPGLGEVHASRGTLDDSRAPTIELLCPDYKLTGQSPARGDGEVRPGSFSADEDLSHVYVVWVDSRAGTDRLFFKRTDTFGAAPISVNVTANPCAAGGGLLVAWVSPTAAPNCDEDRVRVEYGLAPFSYTSSVEVRGASSVVLTGLEVATRYYVLVTRVDQACNAWSAFETSAVTPICSGLPLCPNPVSNTLLMWRMGADVRAVWSAPAIDASHDAATSYDVFRSVTRGRDGYSLLANAPATAFDDLGAAPPGAPGTKHYYRIVARNSCGTSGDEPLP